MLRDTLRDRLERLEKIEREGREERAEREEKEEREEREEKGDRRNVREGNPPRLDDVKGLMAAIDEALTRWRLPRP